MNRDERKKYLKSLGIDESTLRAVEEAQRISRMIEPYRESILKTLDAVESFDRTHFGVDAIAEKPPAFLDFGTSKAMSDISAVAAKHADMARQLEKAIGPLSAAQHSMLDAMKGFTVPAVDFPWLRDSKLAADFERLNTDVLAQMSMFRDLGPTLARVLEVQQSFLRGLDLPDVEALRGGRQRLLRDTELLAKAGWTFSPDMSVAEISELAEKVDDPAAIDEWFVGYYDAERGEQFRLLSLRLIKRKRLATWRALLREGLWAYRRKRYRLVVPAILATIEGLVCEITGTIRERGVNAHVNWDKHSTKPPEGFLVHVHWCAVTAFLGGLWSRSDFGGPQPDGLNRHWVVHGRHPQIGGRADALRLLAAVDFIADAADRIDRLNKTLEKRKPKDGTTKMESDRT